MTTSQLGISLLVGIAAVAWIAWRYLLGRRPAPVPKWKWCPKCRAEYLPGFSECADCHVPLTDVRPVERTPDYTEMVPLVESVDAGELAVIESLLSGGGVHYVVQRRAMSRLVICILVAADQVDEARRILAARES